MKVLGGVGLVSESLTSPSYVLPYASMLRLAVLQNNESSSFVLIYDSTIRIRTINVNCSSRPLNASALVAIITFCY